MKTAILITRLASVRNILQTESDRDELGLPTGNKELDRYIRANCVIMQGLAEELDSIVNELNATK